MYTLGGGGGGGEGEVRGGGAVATNLDTGGSIGQHCIGWLQIDHIVIQSRARGDLDLIKEVGLAEQSRRPAHNGLVPLSPRRDIGRSLRDIGGGEGDEGSGPLPHMVEGAQRHCLRRVKSQSGQLVLCNTARDIRGYLTGTLVFVDESDQDNRRPSIIRDSPGDDSRGGAHALNCDVHWSRRHCVVCGLKGERGEIYIYTVGYVGLAHSSVYMPTKKGRVVMW